MYTNFHDLKKPFEDKKVDVTIILPIYNPNDSWDLELEKNLDEIFELFKHLMIKVILVNDGTSFCMLQKAKRLKNRFPDLETVNHIKNRGKGFAIRSGILFAESNYYIYSDWNFPFGKKIVYDMFSVLSNTNTDIVVSRSSNNYYKSLPFTRRIISQCLAVINSEALVCGKIETLNGLKGLNTVGVKILMKTKTNSDIFEYELIRAILKKKVNLTFINSTTDKNIVLNNFKPKTVLRETKSLIRILMNRT